MLNARTVAMPPLRALTRALPLEGAICFELQEGVPIFRATAAVQARIEALLAKQREEPLSSDEQDELDRYEEIDDYLSFVNRLVRNQHQDG